MLDPPPPALVVAALPEWLGRRPIAGETVLVGFAEYDDQRCVTITLDPDRDPTHEVAALRQAVVDGATDLVIVAISGDESPELEATLQFLAVGAARFALAVSGVVLVVPPQRDRPGYWRTLPAPEQYPLPSSYARTEETS